jgi:hypothetical protein
MIDNEVDGDVGVDLGGIGSKTLGGISHGGQIDHSRDTGEILKNHTSRLEGNLSIGLGGVGYMIVSRRTVKD